jgi:hypothetical protein
LAEKRKTIYVIQGSQSTVYEAITTFLAVLMMEAAGSTERYVYVNQITCHCIPLHTIIKNGNYRLNYKCNIYWYTQAIKEEDSFWITSTSSNTDIK